MLKIKEYPLKNKKRKISLKKLVKIVDKYLNFMYYN